MQMPPGGRGRERVGGRPLAGVRERRCCEAVSASEAPSSFLFCIISCSREQQPP